jgi:hypothetical protein
MSLRAIMTAMALFLLPVAGIAYRHSGPGRAVWITDPMFGLEFHPSMVKYELMPAKVLRTCGDFLPGRYWIFAHLRKGDTDYFVETGMSPKQEGDIFGGVLAITDSKCQSEDSTWMLSGFVPMNGYPQAAAPVLLPGFGAKSMCGKGPLGDCHYILRSAAEEAILRGLVRDGLARGIRAWGGVARFKREVCRPRVIEANVSQPIVRQELITFCKQ